MLKGSLLNRTSQRKVVRGRDSGANKSSHCSRLAERVSSTLGIGYTSRKMLRFSCLKSMQILLQITSERRPFLCTMVSGLGFGNDSLFDRVRQGIAMVLGA